MRKVLVVDDEFLVRVGIKSFLNWEENGYTIIGEAADGKQALEIMERELPDVVLTDLKMDCKACEWKIVCDEVEGMKVLHQKQLGKGQQNHKKS